MTGRAKHRRRERRREAPQKVRLDGKYTSKESVGGKFKHSQMEQEEDRGRRKDESGKKNKYEGTEATSTNEAEKVSAGVFKMGYTTFETRRTERQRAAEEVKQKKSER